MPTRNAHLNRERRHGVTLFESIQEGAWLIT